ncbi:hypothetical protein MNEG_3244 [Monoraphidium neglectum]|uniref:ZNF380 coiled-coil domain-containing protein n=1 Tax=Monoraphidium neglectum TaxID=145388 RepID=A0A0D2MW65_9CHLO|nr:hypothetical protein MNEG_3244 [Monoraphidium neglectum]KIZ04712.1 hypothetical protein MNEG_3244 [Monoraphidium neglectum]|eukprot:XP_013903731.1 hypothetical protein MNEG_3244 [Monoraphidium neglectum]
MGPPAVPATPVPTAAAPGASALPAGLPTAFFDDKAADAKARGIKIPDKADKEAAFAAFASDIASAMVVQAAEEEEDAAEAAEEREEREALEQRLRQERIERLKRMRSTAAAGASAPERVGQQHQRQHDTRQAGAAREEDEAEGAGVLGPGPPPAEMAEAVAAGLPPGRRWRVMDALAEVLGAESGGSDDEDEEGQEEGVLDWRRKAV